MVPGKVLGGFKEDLGSNESKRAEKMRKIQVEGVMDC